MEYQNCVSAQIINGNRLLFLPHFSQPFLNTMQAFDFHNARKSSVTCHLLLSWRTSVQQMLSGPGSSDHARFTFHALQQCGVDLCWLGRPIRESLEGYDRLLCRSFVISASLAILPSNDIGTRTTTAKVNGWQALSWYPYI